RRRDGLAAIGQQLTKVAVSKTMWPVLAYQASEVAPNGAGATAWQWTFTSQFTLSRLVVILSVSAYNNVAANVLNSFAVDIDGQSLGLMSLFMNEINTHK